MLESPASSLQPLQSNLPLAVLHCTVPTCHTDHAGTWCLYYRSGAHAAFAFVSMRLGKSLKSPCLTDLVCWGLNLLSDPPSPFRGQLRWQEAFYLSTRPNYSIGHHYLLIHSIKWYVFSAMYWVLSLHLEINQWIKQTKILALANLSF